MSDPWSPQRPGPNGETRVEPIVTVITPTIEPRFELLHEAAMSIRNQTLKGVEHKVLLDARGDGPAATRNLMLAATTTPLVAFLDDDDIMDADHLESLLAVLEAEGAAVAYSYCRVTGPNRVDVPRPTDARQVWRTMNSGRNVIPVTVLARTEAIRAGGGFDPRDRYEDYSLWMRLKRLGHRFALLPRETWEYRMLGQNRTHS